jgi:hypothetical protein
LRPPSEPPSAPPTRSTLWLNLALSPSVCQSGAGPAYHGRITKQGCVHAPGMLVDATWAAARLPRGRWGRRGQHVAAVATAHKLAVMAWHMLRRGEDCAWGWPALPRKLRELERRGERCPARAQGSGCGPGPKHVVLRRVLNRLKPPTSGSCEAGTRHNLVRSCSTAGPGDSASNFR